jgi:selenocysteine lyase/cysteine desulfurase
MVSAFLPIDSARDLQDELWRDHRIEIPVETLSSTPLIRLSVQAYTTEAECELLVSAVARYRNR